MNTLWPLPPASFRFCTLTCIWFMRSPRRKLLMDCAPPGAKFASRMRTIATVDHNIPTEPRGTPITDADRQAAN